MLMVLSFPRQCIEQRVEEHLGSKNEPDTITASGIATCAAHCKKLPRDHLLYEGSLKENTSLHLHQTSLCRVTGLKNNVSCVLILKVNELDNRRSFSVIIKSGGSNILGGGLYNYNSGVRQ